jgi:acyl carrier protein
MIAHHIVEIFRRVLEIEDIQVNSDFFLLGGDSLLATRILSAIAREFNVELSLTDFLTGSTPQALAACVKAAVEIKDATEMDATV